MSHAESGRDPPAQELAHEQGDPCPISYGECRDRERTKDATAAWLTSRTLARPYGECRGMSRNAKRFANGSMAHTE